MNHKSAVELISQVGEPWKYDIQSRSNEVDDGYEVAEIFYTPNFDIARLPFIYAIRSRIARTPEPACFRRHSNFISRSPSKPHYDVTDRSVRLACVNCTLYRLLHKNSGTIAREFPRSDVSVPAGFELSHDPRGPNRTYTSIKTRWWSWRGLLLQKQLSIFLCS